MLCRCCLNSALPSRNSRYSAFPLLNTSSQRHCLALPQLSQQFCAYAVFTMLFQSKSERCPALPLQVISSPVLNSSALCQRNSYPRFASAGLFFALPLLNKAPPHLTNNAMPFDAKACPLRSKPSRFSAILHNAYAYRSNPMPSPCHALFCPRKTNNAFPSQINLN